ncbi:TIGR03915 family putative DNA repair protein [Sphingobacterium hotanense]|uniref:TIGR03915 family putative DNA repair protein n=1 Tax=Sphingobacterium hotanense TaxID=649196 RepID=UPI0021A4CD4C|nr:TIGR03915 family putative DNA repair protein [Sphingobacterium hotanense]MCT1523135.1 TIGR03915 family putative DNA repair protein [Sphingobacterium hotanense]
MTYYIFDGSYLGYLSAFFQSFQDRKVDAVPMIEEKLESSLFAVKTYVETDSERAKRILKGLEKHIGKERVYDFYRNFLSEDPKAWHIGFKLMRSIFTNNSGILKNYADADALAFSQTIKKMGRESHRMKAFIRFSKSADELYSAIIEPDFNVLPLIISFFKKRFADQRWLIYDVKRRYGYLYNLQDIQEVTLSEASNKDADLAIQIELDKQETHYQQLWKAYFKATNIVVRKNIKLHVQHVPKRYWKYLVEKQD